MRITICILFLTIGMTSGVAQQFESTNSGGFSSNNLIHSIGTIYVNNPDDNLNSSGFVGVVTYSVIGNLSEEEFISPNTISVFPNPFDDIINLKNSHDAKKYIIHDLQGRKVLESNLDSNSINLENLNSGAYIISFDKRQKTSIKIIKI